MDASATTTNFFQSTSNAFGAIAASGIEKTGDFLSAAGKAGKENPGKTTALVSGGLIVLALLSLKSGKKS